MRASIIFLLCSLFILSDLEATIRNVPSEYPTIQVGIDSALVGDTVLVQPGTYIENINLYGKNITVASLFLTSDDTSYISQTIIDGGFSNSVVIYENGEDYTSILTGFTITNGFAFPDNGGGIKCTNNSSPTLEYLYITDNGARNGGGIFCSINSDPSIKNVLINDNASLFSGGGIFCQSNSSPDLNTVSVINNVSNQDGGGMFLSANCLVNLNHVTIDRNRSLGSGGGIYCETHSHFTADSTTINYNFASDFGGGIFCSESSPILTNVIVANDTAYQGGGFFLESSLDLTFENVTISGNKSYTQGGGIGLYESKINFKNSRIFRNHAFGSGGGLYLAYSTLSFDEANPSDIYLNHAGYDGNDLYSEDGELIQVTVDTFTVKYPTDYQAYPFDAFDISNSNFLIEQVNADLYVSPNGDNSASGLNQDEPLKTIFYALTKVIANTLRPHTIWLSNGEYSSDTNGEIFPLNMKAFVSLDGDKEGITVLNAQKKSNVVIFNNDQAITLSRLVLTGGSADFGGGIYCENASPLLSKITLTKNNAFNGGGIYCWESDPVIVNSILWDNFPESVFFESFGDTSSIVIGYSDVQGGQNNIQTNDNGTLYWQDGNIDADPLFTDTSALDFSLVTGSACIDSGTALFEWQDVILINLDKENGDYKGDNPDMGAYEATPSSIAYNTAVPKQYALHQNYPNPFNPATKIRFDLPKSEKVKIEIFNTLGQRIETIFDGKFPSGNHEIEFNGNNYASGIYFYSMKAGNYNNVRKMILVK